MVGNPQVSRGRVLIVKSLANQTFLSHVLVPSGCHPGPERPFGDRRGTVCVRREQFKQKTYAAFSHFLQQIETQTRGSYSAGRGFTEWYLSNEGTRRISRVCGVVNVFSSILQPIGYASSYMICSCSQDWLRYIVYCVHFTGVAVAWLLSIFSCLLRLIEGFSSFEEYVRTLYTQETVCDLVLSACTTWSKGIQSVPASIDPTRRVLFSSESKLHSPAHLVAPACNGSPRSPFRLPSGGNFIF